MKEGHSKKNLAQKGVHDVLKEAKDLLKDSQRLKDDHEKLMQRVQKEIKQQN